MAALTALLCVSYVNSTMCWHSHVIGGVVIVHSHFYSKKHTQQSTDGGHTQGQLQVIQESNALTFTDRILPEINLERIDVPTAVFSVPDVSAPEIVSVRTASLRAPPVV